MKKKKELNKEISNYVKVFFVFLAVIVLVLFLRKWYLNSQELESNIPVLDGVVTHQIKSNEIYNFVLDNDTSLIYMCVANDSGCRKLEKSMKKVIRSNSLEDVIVYLNLSDSTNVSSFYKELVDKYEYDGKLMEYPTFLYFEDGKISKSLSGKNVSINEVKKFLKEISLIS